MKRKPDRRMTRSKEQSSASKFFKPLLMRAILQDSENGWMHWRNVEGNLRELRPIWLPCARERSSKNCHLAKKSSSCFRLWGKLARGKCFWNENMRTARAKWSKVTSKMAKLTKLPSASKKSKLKRMGPWRTKTRSTLSFTRWSWFLRAKTTLERRFWVERSAQEQ